MKGEDVKREPSPLLSYIESPPDTNKAVDSELQVMASASGGIQAVVSDEFPSSISTLVKGYTDGPLPLVKYDARDRIRSVIYNDEEFLVVGNLARRSPELFLVYGATSRPTSLGVYQAFLPGPGRFVPISCFSALRLSAWIPPSLMDWSQLTDARPLLLGAPDDHERVERHLPACTPPLVPCNWIPISSLPAQPISLDLSADLSGNVSSVSNDCLGYLEMNSGLSPRSSEVSVFWHGSPSSPSQAWRRPLRRHADELNRDDLILKTEDNLYSLIQGVLFCLLLSTPAVYLLCLVWYLSLPSTQTSVVTSSIPRWTRSVAGFDSAGNLSVS
ncbi:hypothetical protein GY45DRAFT_938668 [Cubamyces sp. BRFM 1775]|nr:hypothetical protein GY45DRAFT_938668 [Cubamyces sp. BRFM 1775]